MDEQGWGRPPGARKEHYFRGVVSICGRWLFGGDLADDKSAPRQPDDCVECTAILNKAEAKV